MKIEGPNELKKFMETHPLSKESEEKLRKFAEKVAKRLKEEKENALEK